MGSVALVVVLVLAGAFFAFRPARTLQQPLPPLPTEIPEQVHQVAYDNWKPRFDSKFSDSFAQARPQSLKEYVDVLAVIWTQVEALEPALKAERREFLRMDTLALAQTLSAAEIQQLETMKTQSELTNGHVIVIKNLIESAQTP